jgi:hypothetical protein
VAAALSDPDWEVRASAMLVAARLSLRGLALQIRRLKLPSSPREGVHSLDGRILEAARVAALELLDGRVPAGELLDDPRRRNLFRCVAGVEPVAIDRVFLLLHALGTPIEAPMDAPPAPLCGFELAWVPAVRHWVGAVDDLAGQWPLRAMDSPGYSIAKDLLDNGALVTWEQAVSRVEALARETGLPFQLPSKELLEMARRGNDGRLFPWGNGREELEWPLPSPWGLRLSPIPEWTASTAADGEQLHTATPGDLRCAAFSAGGFLAAIRPVLLS